LPELTQKQTKENPFTSFDWITETAAKISFHSWPRKEKPSLDTFHPLSNAKEILACHQVFVVVEKTVLK
jgi:hypothetical protein